MTDQDEKTTEIEETAESVRDSVVAAMAEMTEETPEEQPEAAPVETSEEVTEDAPAETPEAPEPLARPEWWAEGRSGVWEGLSREDQEMLLAHEKAHTEAIEKERLPNEVRGALGQIESHAQMYGITTDQALTRLYRAQRMLESNPRHAIAHLAAEFGVDLSQFAAQVDESGQVQPAEDPLQAVRDVVRTELSGFQQHQADLQAQQRLAELQDWASEKDDSGNLLRPHFEELQHLVKPELDRILASNPGQNPWSALETAYDNVAAAKAVPDIDSLVNQRVEEALKARNAEAEKARKAAVSPASGASGSTRAPNGSAGSVLDDVKAAAAELGDSARI